MHKFIFLLTGALADSSALLRALYSEVQSVSEAWDDEVASFEDYAIIEEHTPSQYYDSVSRYSGYPATSGASYNPYSHPGPSYPGSSNYPSGPYGVDVGTPYRPNPPQPYGNFYNDPYRGRGRDGPRGGLGRTIPVPPAADIPQAPPSTLQKFEGTWVCDIHSSQPLDDILNALGVAPIKIRFLDGYAPVTTIRLTSPDNLRMDNRLPGGLVVGSNVPLDGRSFTFQDQETGNWESSAAFDGSKLVQERRSSRGTMYDVRAVYDSNPRTGAPGRWMLFKWSFKPSTGGLLSAERWLRRTQ